MCQPLDVGVNKSFKARVRRLWEEWLTNLLDEVDAVRDATRGEVSEWMVSVYWEMVGLPVLRNSWRRTGFDWFPGLTYEEGDDVVVDNAGDEDGNKGGENNDSDACNDSLFDSDDKGEDSIDGKD